MTLQQIKDDVDHTARLFCGELHKNMASYFDYILNPAAPDFIDLYYVASYLAPIHKFVIGPTELTIVRKYLESKHVLCLLFLDFLLSFQNMSPHLMTRRSPLPLHPATV